MTILYISAPLYPISLQTRLGAMSRSGTLYPNKVTYYTSVKQRELQYCCQLYFADDIYERLCSARRAYIPILPAVKTK